VKSAGAGYVEGTLRFLDSFEYPGSGFLGRFYPQGLKFSRSGASYVYVGGNIVCAEGLYSCLKIESEGKGYPISSPKSFEVAEFGDGLDPRCPEKRCDPIDKEVNCVISSNQFCWYHKIERKVDVFFSEGCSVDDTNCGNVVQTRSITSVTVFRWGHSHGCFVNSQITGTGGQGTGFSAAYDVDSKTGQISKVSFSKAQDHGKDYDSDPTLMVQDVQCRCGTTVTDLRISVGGTGADLKCRALNSESSIRSSIHCGNRNPVGFLIITRTVFMFMQHTALESFGWTVMEQDTDFKPRQRLGEILQTSQ
jgi:hypothetical protein